MARLPLPFGEALFESELILSLSSSPDSHADSHADSDAIIDEAEIAKFERDADQWWDPHGVFAPLHALNPTRLRFIRDSLVQICAPAGEKKRALAGLRVLDVGCGGGLTCEPLARLGAQLMGIDGSALSVAAARAHAESSGLSIDYQTMDSTACAQECQSGRLARFDAVLALEIVEHVNEVPVFLSHLATCLRPGGALILSTLNRTLKSFALGIVAAEYILGWAPRGTHEFRRFLRPSEPALLLGELGCVLVRQAGLRYNLSLASLASAPFDSLSLGSRRLGSRSLGSQSLGSWSLDDNDLEVNYIQAYKKSSDSVA